jgi:hypothetical protein
MKCKNIFFVTCASIIIISKISAMQLGTQRVIKSMHRIYRMGPMLQKRNFNIDPDLVAFLWIVGGIMCANYIDGTLGASREAEKEFFKNFIKQQNIDQKIVKKCQNSSLKIPEFKLKISEFKLLTDGSQQQRE